MPNLLLAGSFDARVVLGSWTKRSLIYQGGRQRMRANNTLSTEDETTAKRVYDCQVDLYDDADEAALRSACPRGVPITVEGDLPGTSLNALVDIGDVPWPGLEDESIALTDCLRIATLHIEEA